MSCPSPRLRERTGAKPSKTPIPIIIVGPTIPLATPIDATARVEYFPATQTSPAEINIWPTCPTIIGSANVNNSLTLAFKCTLFDRCNLNKLTELIQKISEQSRVKY